jgi:hypothetical protein
MMDPLSALSLAAAVAQFIDFGSELVCHTKEIVKSGSSVNVQHLSRVASDLVEINSSIKKQLQPMTTKSLPITKEAQVSTWT